MNFKMLKDPQKSHKQYKYIEDVEAAELFSDIKLKILTSWLVWFEIKMDFSI